jgi:hypothetical protein
MRIRILLLIKVMRIYDRSSAYPPNFDNYDNADPDPAFHYHAVYSKLNLATHLPELKTPIPLNLATPGPISINLAISLLSKSYL